MFKTCLLLAFSLSPAIWRQIVGASISGTVKDATGEGLPSAAVTIKSLETGAERNLTTDNAGRYAAPSTPVGAYQVIASKTGFTTQMKTGIDLAVGQHSVVDITLSVGELKQVITVEEFSSPVNFSTQQTSGLVNERQVKDLPLNGRSYDELITLNPSIVNYTSGRSGGVGTSNSSVGNMFAVSGRRPQENLFLLNGIEYTGASLINNTPGGTSGQLLGVDAVREFNVVTGDYGAEYGKRAGAQVSIVTASGSNQVHGNLYEFLRNSDLDARNFFDQGSIPHFARNEFGSSVGGPVKKNKLFLFGNYEGYRQHLGVSDVTLVPDNGDSRNPIRPSWNPAFSGTLVTGNPNQYFNPNAFLSPATGTYGNVGRNVLTGPGLAELDLSFSKTTSLTERLRLQFRAELFNILNRANFGAPNAVVYSSATTTPAPTAGVITSTATTSRQIQFGLKLQW